MSLVLISTFSGAPRPRDARRSPKCSVVFMTLRPLFSPILVSSNHLHSIKQINSLIVYGILAAVSLFDVLLSPAPAVLWWRLAGAVVRLSRCPRRRSFTFSFHLRPECALRSSPFDQCVRKIEQLKFVNSPVPHSRLALSARAEETQRKQPENRLIVQLLNKGVFD